MAGRDVPKMKIFLPRGADDEDDSEEGSSSSSEEEEEEEATKPKLKASLSNR